MCEKGLVDSALCRVPCAVLTCGLAKYVVSRTDHSIRKGANLIARNAVSKWLSCRIRANTETYFSINLRKLQVRVQVVHFKRQQLDRCLILEALSLCHLKMDDGITLILDILTLLWPLGRKRKPVFPRFKTLQSHQVKFCFSFTFSLLGCHSGSSAAISLSFFTRFYKEWRKWKRYS